jgi:1,4-dihydroxy-2-naphthoate octaprenyltransferase
LPGILPFTAGAIAGWRESSSFNFNLFLICLIGIILIMLMGFLTDEYIDYSIDKANITNTKYSGGSRVLVEGHFGKNVALITGIICGILFVAIIIPLYFKYYFRSFPYIVLFGIIGFFIGYAYGDPPFKFSYKGLGEALTAFGCGYLAISVGYYISTGKVGLTPFVLSFPPALTVFCLAFINAYPDIESDRDGGKKTLPVIFGIEKMNYVYMISLILADVFLILSPVLINAPKLLYLFSLPSIVLTYLSVKMILNGKYKKKEELEALSLYTLLMMIFASISIIFAYLLAV